MFLSLKRSDVSVSALMDGCAEDAIGLGSEIPPQRSGDHTWRSREQKDLSAGNQYRRSGGKGIGRKETMKGTQQGFVFPSELLQGVCGMELFSALSRPPHWGD